MDYEFEEPNELQFRMPMKWYSKIGKNTSSNAKRDASRQTDRDMDKDELVLKGNITTTLDKAVASLKDQLKVEKRNSELGHLQAVIHTADFFEKGRPLMKTQMASNIYRQDVKKVFLRNLANTGQFSKFTSMELHI